jgi:hypothetical protein
MTVDRSALDAQLRAIGEGERWWEHSEFRELPYILERDESIRGIVEGKLLGRRVPRLLPAPGWLIVVTDRRILCLRQERFARRQVDVPSGQILRIHQGGRLRGYRIVVETMTRKYRIHIRREDAFRFTGALAHLVPQRPLPPPHPDLAPLAWIPGMATVASLPAVATIVSRISMLSPPGSHPARADRATRIQRRGVAGECPATSAAGRLPGEPPSDPG